MGVGVAGGDDEPADEVMLLDFGVVGLGLDAEVPELVGVEFGPATGEPSAGDGGEVTQLFGVERGLGAHPAGTQHEGGPELEK